MATKLTERRIQQYAKWTDAELRSFFDRIGTVPEHRVKSGPMKGCVKTKWAKEADVILAELSRRSAS